MSRIDSVELKGHGNAPVAKKLYLTTRKLSNFSTDHFHGGIKEMWLVVTGAGLTPAINKLEVTYNGTTYPVRVIEVLAQDANTIHIWFAAYKDELGIVEAIRETAGVGAITVTIVTDTGGTQTGTGAVSSAGS